MTWTATWIVFCWVSRFDPLKPEFKTCLYRDVEVHACGPIGYTGDPDALYRNNGDGAFTEVTEAAGVADKKRYYGFQAVFADFNNDGWPDLLVANDSNPNYLYRNKHDGTFEEVGIQADRLQRGRQGNVQHGGGDG